MRTDGHNQASGGDVGCEERREGGRGRYAHIFPCIYVYTSHRLAA